MIVGAGVVLAASYEAKAYGVRTAMGGARARSLCPKAVVVSPRMSAYTEASKAVFAVFEDTAPVVEGLSIDEAFLDVRGLDHISGTPVEIAARLRRRVRREVGLPITVGVARTKFLAKVASAVAKPDGLLLVAPERELEFLHPLPVEALWGVGRVTAGQAARARDHDRRSGGAARRARARADARPRVGAPPARAGQQLRPPAGAGPPPPPVDRRASGRSAAGDGRAQELASALIGARRPGLASAARGPAGLPDRRAADAIRGLLARHALVHDARARPIRRPRSSKPPTGCSRRRCR